MTTISLGTRTSLKNMPMVPYRITTMIYFVLSAAGFIAVCSAGRFIPVSLADT